jgi:ribosomal protein L15
MMKFPWKTTIAISAVLAATIYAFAQTSPGGPMGMHGRMAQGGMDGSMAQMHQQMMQGQSGMQGGMGQGMQGGMGMRGGMGGHGGMHGKQVNAAGTPTLPGQDAFGTVQEVVQILQADRTTDWSKVNIAALRQHLIDMNEVTLNAVTAERMLDNGIEIAVTGGGRTLEAIKRMVPAHVNELREIGWNAKSDELPNGIKLTVIASEAQSVTKLKALGFMGIMVQGNHHQPHHLMMAKGEFAMH